MKILNKSDLNEAKEILLNDGIIAFPTETVYGLGVTYDKYDNYLKLVKAKNRPDDKPFTIMCTSFDDVKDIVEINEVTQKIINKFTPGPITLILKIKKMFLIIQIQELDLQELEYQKMILFLDLLKKLVNHYQFPVLIHLDLNPLKIIQK